MRAGAWDGAVTTDNVRVWVDGTLRPVDGVKIQSGMKDGHPASETSSWCVEATIDWADPNSVSSDTPHPFGTGTDWLPRAGDSVVVETGDGATGQWFVQHRGVIDTTTGSFADGTAVSSTVDAIEELGNTVSLAPIMSHHPPRFNADPNYRNQGMSSLFMVDRVIRNMQHTTGWYAIPPPTWQTVGIATGMGSLRPEDRGELLYGHRFESPNGYPEWVNTPYGIAPGFFEAEYALDMTTGYSTGRVIVTAAVPIVSTFPAASNHWRMHVTNDAGVGFRVWHRADTDLIYWQTTDNAYSGNRAAVDPATGRRAQRFAVYFSPNSGVQLRMDDGRESTTTFSWITGWSATKAKIDSPRVGGWWIIEGLKDTAQRWATLNHVPTARLRQKHIVPWHSSRGLQWTAPSDFLQDQLLAECSTMWLDEDGIMQWAGRGVLDEQPVSQTITSTLQVDDVKWAAARRSLGRSVHLQHLEPNVRSTTGGHRVDLWEDGSSDLASGEQDILTINIPGDEDWVSVDLNTRLMSASTTPALLREGSWHGGAYYRDVDGETSEGWAVGITAGFVRLALRSWQMTVASWTSNPSGYRIKTVIPKTGDKLGEMHDGKPALRIRGKAKITWVEAEKSRSAGATGPARYNHDASWHVQGIAVDELLVWLAGVVSSTNPIVTGLELEHDPRRQVGDKIRVEDRHVTGVWVEVLVQERATDTGDFTDTISGRITASGDLAGLSLPSPAGPKAINPPSNWNREVAP